VGRGAHAGYLVECYWTGVSEEELAAAMSRASAIAAEVRTRGGDVDIVGSILVPEDETVFCLFDGAEEDVREVSEHAEVPFARVVRSVRIDGMGDAGAGGDAE
jgi:hypothetical protein